MADISKICGVAIADISKITTILLSNIASFCGVTVPPTEVEIDFTLQTPDGLDLLTPEGDTVIVSFLAVEPENSTHGMTNEIPTLFGVSTILETPQEEEVKTPEDDFVAIVE